MFRSLKVMFVNIQIMDVHIGGSFVDRQINELYKI